MADGIVVRKVSYEVASRKLKAIATVLQRPLQDVLESGARVAATQMARTAQPFGTGQDALDSGRKAVARDIAKVYGTPGGAYESIPNEKQKAAFWRKYKAGEFEAAQAILILSGSRWAGVPLQPFDGGSAHKAARGKRSGGGRGMVRLSKPVMIVVNPKDLARYVEKVQGNVGFGKGGFADITRALGTGSARGLRQEGDITANWITRKAHGFGKAYHGGDNENPTIRIESVVPYASEILNGTALAAAKRIAHDRMLENLRIAVNAEVKNLRSAA